MLACKSIDPKLSIREGEVMSKKPIHTVPTATGWSNKQGGKVISNHRTKEAARGEGRRLAMRRQTEHAVHNKNGQIGIKNSYGKDSNPPKDKNR